MHRSPKEDQSFVVVTCADAKFFHVLQAFEKNVLKFQGSLPIVYDLGMTEEQKNILNSEVYSCEFDDDFANVGAEGFIKTTHKPNAIISAMERFDKDVLYLDVDMLLTSKIVDSDFQNADIAVTPRHPRELMQEKLSANGDINAGFLFFRNSDASKRLLNEWQSSCAKSESSDQKLMSELLQVYEIVASDIPETIDGLCVAKLDPVVFNDTSLKTGKILHFKGLGRKDKNLKKWKRSFWLLTYFPVLLQAQVWLKRKLA